MKRIDCLPNPRIVEARVLRSGSARNSEQLRPGRLSGAFDIESISDFAERPDERGACDAANREELVSRRMKSFGDGAEEFGEKGVGFANSSHLELSHLSCYPLGSLASLMNSTTKVNHRQESCNAFGHHSVYTHTMTESYASLAKRKTLSWKCQYL